MLVTITQFRELARDNNGNVVPLGSDRIGCEARTSAGAFTALKGEVRFVRVATDTPIQMDIAGGSTDTTDELFVPGVEYVAVRGGETLTIALA